MDIAKTDNPVSINGVECQEDDLQLPVFKIATIEAATDNFSTANKIGEGGFGSVYKVKHYFLEGLLT